VASTNLSFTKTQPQCILGQVALSDASIASFKKYSSHDGLRFELISNNTLKEVSRKENY
jgi:hypothetical protein